MTITIGAGPTNASQSSGGHRVYTWAGVKYPSVTSIPKLVGMPDRLHRWFVANLIDYVIANASNIGLRVATGDERELKVLRSNLWKATDGDDSGRIVGIAVHRAAALGIDPATAHPGVAPKLRQYLDWRETSGVQIIASEFQVWNLSEGYAGTVDLLGRFADGSTWLLDLKSGRGLYAEHVLQLVAYLMAEFVGANDAVDERLSASLAQVSGVGILHLADTGWEFISLKLPELAKAWTAFRGLIRFAGWLQANDSLDGLVAARRWSDGRSTELGGRTFEQLGWVWARLGTNLAHLVPPHGDLALCMRAVERTRRTVLETRPDDVCSRCSAKDLAAGLAA
jgi:hypothetical protein